jgi:multicomponent Na+:H+ antiporter subunit D
MAIATVILAPLLVAVWVLLFRNRPNAREFGSLAGSVVMAAAAGSLALRVCDGAVEELRIVSLVTGADLALRADALGSLFAALAAGLWVLTTMYSVGYMRGLAEHAQARYYFFFALCLMGAAGVALAANLLTFLIFYEVLTLATWPLVVHKESQDAIRAGRRYLAYTLTAGVLLFLATAWIHVLAGDGEFRPGGFLPAVAPVETQRAIFVLLALGVGVKAAVMPLHAWLPEAMIAPTPVSALLHAVAVVKAGVFGMLRVVGYVFGPEATRQIGAGPVVAGFAAATIVLSSMMALAQDNLKRRLAYSTIGQLSYIVLGAAIGTARALQGAAFHIVAHAFLKIALFFCAGAIYVRTHKETVRALDGIGRQMPFTIAAFAVGALGLAGIPPMAAFWSKWNLIAPAGGWFWAAVLAVSGVLNLAYLFPIVWRGFLRPSPDHLAFGEASAAMVVPIVSAALLGILAGAAENWPLPFFRLAEMAAREMTGP